MFSHKISSLSITIEKIYSVKVWSSTFSPVVLITNSFLVCHWVLYKLLCESKAIWSAEPESGTWLKTPGLTSL